MHITKNSIFRKVVILSMAVLVFVSSLLGSTASTANAVGVDTVVKLAGGKAVVRALAEKAGVALSPKQLDNVVDLIEKKTFDGDQNAIDFATKANSLTPSGDSTKSGFKKYLLDPLAWLTGLDLIFLAIDAFQDGYDTSSPVPIYKQCVKAQYKTNGSPISIGDSGYIIYTANNGDKLLYVLNGTVQMEPYLLGGEDIGAVTVISPSGWWEYGANHNEELWTFKSYFDTYTSVTFMPEYGSWSLSTDEIVCDYTPQADDVVNINNVNTTTYNNFQNNTYNTNTTYNIEIDLPDVINYADPTPWNEVDPNIADEVDPVVPPPDTDGDGVTDDKDSDADKGGFLENLLAIVTLMAIFDLLKAVIFYLARMFEFILTIPLIEAKPIDNVAFEWFRTAEIVGVEIYSIISLLATVGLSFAVYKVVRRLLP